MGARIDVWDAEHLWLINGIVHDTSYAVSDHRLGPEPGTLTVPFRRPREDRRTRPLFRRRPAPELVPWLLRICNVTDHRITDDQGIDEYPVNVMRYDEQSGLVTVDTDIPTGFEVRVSALHITLIAEPDT